MVNTFWYWALLGWVQTVNFHCGLDMASATIPSAFRDPLIWMGILCINRDAAEFSTANFKSELRNNKECSCQFFTRNPRWTDRQGANMPHWNGPNPHLRPQRNPLLILANPQLKSARNAENHHVNPPLPCSCFWWVHQDLLYKPSYIFHSSFKCQCSYFWFCSLPVYCHTLCGTVHVVLLLTYSCNNASVLVSYSCPVPAASGCQLWKSGDRKLRILCRKVKIPV